MTDERTLEPTAEHTDSDRQDRQTLRCTAVSTLYTGALIKINILITPSLQVDILMSKHATTLRYGLRMRLLYARS